MRAILRSAAAHLVDFALPPRCPGCGAITGEMHRFCLQCWQSIEWLADPGCARCGLPFAFPQEAGAQCASCLADPPRFDRLRAAVAYGEVARRVALKLKYGGKPGVADTLASFMQRQMHVFGEPLLLVPVPLHRWRIWRRGYNQAALIASALARRTGHPAELDVLRRVKHTPQLRGMGRSERMRAMRGAFAVREGSHARLQGRNVVLIDDVYTSGATANACAAALRRAGADAVNILCWARVVAGEGIEKAAVGAPFGDRRS